MIHLKNRENKNMKFKAHLVMAIFVLGIFACGSNGPSENRTVENTDKNIIFAVPFAPVSYPILKMLEDGKFEKGKRKLQLILWKNPDQLKALVAGHQADFFAVPSNVGAILYNKGLDVKLLNISIWRAIWLVSRNNDKKTLSDFKGETIAMPFKGDMPHLVFMELVKKEGLDPEKDFKLEYVPSPIDAAKKMLMRRVDNALLIDPAVSTVVEKSKSGITGLIAPTIYRSVDIQNEWGRLFNTASEIPFAGIMAGSKILKHPDVVRRFIAEYKEATKWCMKHPGEVAKMVIKYIPQLNEKGVEEAMKNVTLRADDALKSQKALIPFFKILYKSKPSLIGGKMPDANFYFVR